MCCPGRLLKIHRQANVTGSTTRLRFSYQRVPLCPVCGGALNLPRFSRPQSMASLYAFGTDPKEKQDDPRVGRMFAPVILVLSHFMATPAPATLPRYRELKHVGIRMRDHSVLDLKPPTTARPAATHVPRTAFDPAPHPETVRACQRIHSGRAPGLRPPTLPQQSRRGCQRNPANSYTSCDKLPSCCSSSCLARHLWPRSSAVS